MVLSKKSSKFVLSAMLKSISAKSHSPNFYIFCPPFWFLPQIFQRNQSPLTEYSRNLGRGRGRKL